MSDDSQAAQHDIDLKRQMIYLDAAYRVANGQASVNDARTLAEGCGILTLFNQLMGEHDERA